MTQSTIQIYGRVRPLKKNSKVKNDAGRYWITRDNSLNSKPLPTIGFHVPKDEMQGIINHQKENHEFSFNEIFDVDATQDEIFDVVAKPVVDSALLGYNGTIFAYGQTGSGKTYTITGGAERYQDRGLIPRTLQFIFKEIQKDTHSTYHVHVSYLEIYNEIGYDLLNSERDAKKLEDLPKVTLQEDSDEKIHLKNLSVISANNEEEALNLLFVGDTNRMIAETPSNPASSRSHCIFIISIASRKNGEDVIRRSKLHLVDLAGSERVSKTGIDGSLLKEARHINLSLHYLEQVIIALHEASKGRRGHVPYRNSMMTSVLRDSLGGNCKTTMIATLAVEDILVEESISTCRFAKRVALISNNATLNEEMDPKLVISRLKQEISRLKAELAIARGEGTEYTEELPEYEKSRVRDAVNFFINDPAPESELVFADFKKIHYAFLLLKERTNQNPTSAQLDIQNIKPQNMSNSLSSFDFDSSGMAQHQIEQIEKLKKLAEHRDNEIHILVGMIAKLKKEIVDGKSSGNVNSESIRKSSTLVSQRPTILIGNEGEFPKRESNQVSQPLKNTIPVLTTEKARAFEIFKQSYPASEWIDNQKGTLKTMYGEAKKMGEYAQFVRSQIKNIKDQLTNPEADNSLRSKLASLVSEYKTTYAKLKDYKVEVEHLQHLLEQGRIRMTRDFEAWYVEVYMANEEGKVYHETYAEVSKKVPSPPQSINEILSKSLHRDTSSSLKPREAWTPEKADGSSSSYIRNADYIYKKPIETQLKATDSQITITPSMISDISSQQTSFVSDETPSIPFNQKWKSSNEIIHKSDRHRPYSSLSNYSPDKQLNEKDFKIRPSSASLRLSTDSSSNIQKDIAAFYEARERLQANRK